MSDGFLISTVCSCTRVNTTFVSLCNLYAEKFLVIEIVINGYIKKVLEK